VVARLHLCGQQQQCHCCSGGLRGAAAAAAVNCPAAVPVSVGYGNSSDRLRVLAFMKAAAVGGVASGCMAGGRTVARGWG
jgi:hypothetical protein